MKMRKIKLSMAVVAVLGLFATPAAYADGFAPGEGLYIGAFGGTAMGVVQPKVTTGGATTNTNDSNIGGTFEATDGGLALEGIEGGGMLGYGYKMGDLYAGLEGEMVSSDVTFKLTSSVPVTLSGESIAGTGTNTIREIEATKEWTGGAFGRLGYYVNPDTLISLKGGVLVSKFEVKTTGNVNYSEDFYGGGPSFGASMESRVSAIDPNLSIRIGAVYTDFLTASVFGIGANQSNGATTGNNGHNSEVTGSALAVRLGLQYSFFDANSLF